MSTSFQAQLRIHSAKYLFLLGHISTHPEPSYSAHEYNIFWCYYAVWVNKCVTKSYLDASQLPVLCVVNIVSPTWDAGCDINIHSSPPDGGLTGNTRIATHE